MPNNYGENVDSTVMSDTGTDESWQSVEPTTVEDDKELQDALSGAEQVNQDDRALDLDSNVWSGMESGAIQHDSTQSHDWLGTVPEKYQIRASKWMNQQGIIKITPVQQRQKFTYSTVAYIANKQEEPKTQVFPVSNVSVIPHQISFDFYDTTEGRVGVSNAVEKHMIVELDIYLTELIYFWWNNGTDDNNRYNIGLSDALKKKFWNAIDNNNYIREDIITDIEQTKEFVDFRNTFLQQHSGWVCVFNSPTFGIFQGVITDVSYTISEGESFAKWHIKLEEAIFLDEAYSTTGQKQQAETSDGNTENSGDADNTA